MFGFTRRSGETRIGPPAEPRWTCHRDRIVDAPQNDWMEFQAATSGDAADASSYVSCGRVRLRCAKASIRL